MLFFCVGQPPITVSAQTISTTSGQPDAIPLNQPLRFQRFSLEDGLSQNTVFSVIQDHRGFLWIGTQDGLNRYDGYSFQVFKHDPQKPNSLSSSSIISLYEDKDGLLWIGTWGGGLDSYNAQSGQFSRYQNDPANPSSLSQDIVTSILEDRQSHLWVGTCGGGLDLFNRQTGQFHHYQHDASVPSSLASDNVSKLFEDNSGNLWVGTGCLGNPGRGLEKLDLQNVAPYGIPVDHFTHYQNNPKNDLTLSTDNVSSIAQDSSGMVWVGTGGYTLKGAGLNRINPQTGIIERYQHNASDASSLNSDDVMGLMVDASGILWVGTWGGGLDLADLNQLNAGYPLVFVHQTSDPYNSQSVSSNLIWSFLEDRSGVFWIGTANGGLDKVNPQVQRFAVFRNNPGDATSLIYDAVGPVLEDSQGRIWVATLGGGLERFDRQQATFTHFVESTSDPMSQQANTFMALYQDHSGTLWAGTLAGLGQFDPDTGKTTYYRHDAGNPLSLINDNVASLTQDSSGRLWVGTLGGLDYFDPGSGIFTHMQVPGLDTVLKLVLAENNILWVGSWGQGLFRLDLSTLSGAQVSSTRYTNDPANATSLADDNIVDILLSRTGSLWLGTEDGMDRFDPASGRAQHFQVQNGLPDNSVLCMLEDHLGDLWISTNSGLSRFDPKTSLFRNFDVNDGLQSNEFDSGACGISRAGEMYFGGQKGLNVYNPDSIQDNLVAPQVVITSFSILNQPIEVDLSGNSPVTLSYADNFIAFEFVALDFHDPQKNQYSYKLDGFDTDWVAAGTRRYASYTNLRGGNYTFEVKASNNNGIWSETGASIPVRVTPPLWQNWWFQGASLMALVAIVALGVRWRIESVNVQNRHQQEQVQQRILEQAYNELQQAIGEREKAEAALAQKAAGEAVTAERTRLARDLHDAVTQTLFSASLIAEVIPQLWDSNQPEALKRLNELRELTRGALAEMRTLLLELRPSALTDSSLPDLLRQLVESITGRARLPIQFTVDGDQQVPPDVQVVFYRIAQEALNNIVKYARASQLTVNLRLQEGSIRLAIMDNGVGFDVSAVPPNHLGLQIMRERAEAIGARVNVYSEPGEGTQVTVSWNKPDQNQVTIGSGVLP